MKRNKGFDALDQLDESLLRLCCPLLDKMTQSNGGLVRICTVDLPHFFTLVSRIRLKQEEFSADEGSLSATLTPKVKITFPPESFRRKTKVGLQVKRLLLAMFCCGICFRSKRPDIFDQAYTFGDSGLDQYFWLIGFIVYSVVVCVLNSSALGSACFTDGRIKGVRQ